MTTLLRRTPRQRRSRARARYEDHVEQYEERTGQIDTAVWFEGDPLYPVPLSGPITVTLPAVPRSDETITVSTVRSEADERRQAALEQWFGIAEREYRVYSIEVSTPDPFGVPVGAVDVTETSS